MPSASYLLAVLAIIFTLTLALRAVPFAALRTLRNSTIVQQLSVTMPVGILVILAVTALHGTISAEPRPRCTRCSPSLSPSGFTLRADAARS